MGGGSGKTLNKNTIKPKNGFPLVQMFTNPRTLTKYVQQTSSTRFLNKKTEKGIITSSSLGKRVLLLQIYKFVSIKRHSFTIQLVNTFKEVIAHMKVFLREVFKNKLFSHPMS